MCSTKGTPPVYAALIRNSTILQNTTNTDVAIQLYKEGNYTCVATAKYGADVGEFSVIFNGETFLTDYIRNIFSKKGEVAKL